ncbi:MAG: CBS domain-containing protein [Pseudomonadota bacterium]
MPASYQAPNAKDMSRETTVSQSVQTNVATENSTVQQVIDHKGSGVFTISPDDTIAAAVVILRDKRIGALVVADGEGKMHGILSERDIVRKLAETPGQTLPQTVAENMTRDVVTCGLGDPLILVLRRMTEGRFRHMPVLEDGKLRGMLTIGDVIDYRLKELEYEALQLKQMIVG